MRSKVLVTALLLVVVGVVSPWSPPRLVSHTATPTRPAAPARAEKSSDGWVKGTAYVEPEAGVRRLAFKADGVIAECRVAAGDRVRKGAVLLALDNREREAEVTLAEREVALARAERAKALAGAHPEEVAAAKGKVAMLRVQLEHFRQEYERTRRAQRGASDQEVQQSRTVVLQQDAAMRTAEAELRRLQQLVRPEDRDLADAKVRQAEARLALARQRLRDTFLVAPCDGTVLEVHGREGDGLRQADAVPAVVLGDLSRLRVCAEIEPRDATRLRVGQVAVIGRGPHGESCRGRVAAVRPRLGNTATAVQVLLDMGAGFSAPAGLPFDVNIQVRDGTQPDRP